MKQTRILFILIVIASGCSVPVVSPSSGITAPAAPTTSPAPVSVTAAPTTTHPSASTTVVTGALTSTPTPVAPATNTQVASRAVWVIAHRGGAALAPEDTLASFKNGIALGADLIEMDTHLSKDGAVVVIHDATLERTTDATGPVSARTLAELQAVNAAARFKDGSYPRQPVPAFGQVLELLEGNSVRIEVEIKLGGQGRYPGIEAKLLKEVADRNLLDRVQISSFDFGVLREVKSQNPNARTVALITVDFFRQIPVDQPAKVVDAVVATGAELVACNKDLLTPALVQEAHRRGILVEVWTVDTDKEMRRFIDMGVDGIISNQPDLLKQVVAK